MSQTAKKAIDDLVEALTEQFVTSKGDKLGTCGLEDVDSFLIPRMKDIEDSIISSIMKVIADHNKRNAVSVSRRWWETNG